MKKLISRNFLEPRVQEIGRIKIGGRGNKQGKGYIPEKYDHFKVTTMARRDGDGPFELDEAVHGHPEVGEEPRELDGILMFPEVEQNLQTSMVKYAGKKLAVRCDGELRMETETGEIVPCPRAAGGECDCKPYGRLTLQLLASPTTEGYYTFRSTSWTTINNLQTAMEAIHARFGTLFQAPVKLKMYQTEDSWVGVDGKEKRGRSWKVAILLNMSWQEAALQMVDAAELLQASRKKLVLQAGEVEEQVNASEDDDGEEIAEEFFPDEDLVEEAEYDIVEEGDEVPVEEEVREEGAIMPVDHMVPILRDLRDEARELELLDSLAEQFIADALSSKNEVDLDKAIRALNRKFDEVNAREAKEK